MGHMNVNCVNSIVLDPPRNTVISCTRDDISLENEGELHLACYLNLFSFRDVELHTRNT